MDGEAPSEPDSTTVERELIGPAKQFTVQDDVLCQSTHGDQFYLGVVVQVNHNSKKCLVKFLDMTETWCKFQDMKLLNEPEEQVNCVVCKSSQPGVGNQVHVCSCGRGYHQRCHQPHILVRDPAWKCRICSPGRANVSQLHHQLEAECVRCLKREFWYRSDMLQCRRCQQWQHASCLASPIKMPLHGDRFYVMVCSVCNRGREFCCRLAMTWADLLHLAMFNLNHIHRNKFHDLDLTIIPFIKRIWHELQLPQPIAKFDLSNLRDKLKSVLKNSGDRFRNGSELRKRVALWGVRLRGPPRAPVINLPTEGPIDEKLACIRENSVLDQDPPLQNGFVNSSRRDDEMTAVTNNDETVESSSEFHGRGLVKRSVPFPLTEASNSADARFRSNAVRRASRVLLLRRQRRQEAEEEEEEESQAPERLSDSEDEALRSLCEEPTTSSSAEASKKKAKAKRETRKRPQRNLLEARLNSTENKLYNPPVAGRSQQGDASPKKKGRKTEGSKPQSSAKPKRKLVQKTIIESLAGGRAPNAELDSHSSSDERPPPARKPQIRQLLPVTRRLSARDLIVDEHGQVRRRRRFRRVSAPPAIIPPPPPVPASPIIVTPPSWFSDMFTSELSRETVQETLGPLARVKRGEPFDVIGRRVQPSGEVELLLSFSTS